MQKHGYKMSQLVGMPHDLTRPVPLSQKRVYLCLLPLRSSRASLESLDSRVSTLDNGCGLRLDGIYGNSETGIGSNSGFFSEHWSRKLLGRNRHETHVFRNTVT